MSHFFHPLTWWACQSIAIDSTVRTNPSDSPRTTPTSQSGGATTLHVGHSNPLMHSLTGGKAASVRVVEGFPDT
jgi:hypothetical protein